MFLLQDERFRNHRTAARHPESPERLRAVDQGLNQEFPGEPRVEPRLAKFEEIATLHREDYLERVREASESSQSLDADTHTSEDSYETARLAVGGSLELSERIVDEQTVGFGAVRPPGHHAEADRGMGFCLFNNIGLVADQLTEEGYEVVIVDIDCHHGNGTQSMFYKRSDVLYISFHQYPFYPGTGAEDETGRGDGEGFTFNVPLTAGSGWKELADSWERSIRDRIHDFRPDVVLVSAGFDGHVRDPLGGLNLHDEDYCRLGDDLGRWASTLSEGRIMNLLEGGYNMEVLERTVPKFLGAQRNAVG